MKLGSIFSKITSRTDEKKESFLALEINSETIKAAVWSVVGNQVEVLRLGSIEEWETEKELVKAADAAITSASEGITPEPKKVIFGLPEGWVEGDSITSSKKKILSLLSQKLELNPVGFVVSLEALTTYLKQKQGTPPSAIFVRLAETEIVVSLVTLGKIRGSHRVGRSQDLALDIKEGLARFKKADSLPSRIILFDGLSDFEEAKQQIISFDWQANLPFLHFPKVESFERDFVMRAIAIAGGSEVAKSLGFEIVLPEEEIEEAEEEKPEKKKTEEKEAEEEEKETKKEEEEEKKEEKEEGEEKEKEEKDEKEKKEEEEEKPEKERAEEDKEEKRKEGEEEPKEVTAAELGFIADKDVKKEKVEVPKFKVSSPDIHREKISEPTEEERFIEDVEKPRRVGGLLAFFSFIPKIAKLFRFLPKKRLFFITFPVVLVLGLGFYSYFYLLKAEVSLYFSSQTVEKEITVTLDPQTSSLDIEDKIIPAEETSVEVKGESEKDASGEKLVGEKATGEVVVYNKTSDSKTFETGTVLVGGDNLKFVLEDEVTVASSSSQETDEGEEITWGKETVSIAADSVGEESNLGAGSNFSFKDYSSSAFSAKTDEGLTGGSSEEVRVVTKEDRSQLLKKLSKELEEKGKEELSMGLSEDRVILDKILDSEAVKEDYDKKVDEEADKVKLKLTLSVVGLSYEKADLQEFLKKQFEEEVPDEFSLSEEAIETEVLEVDTEEDLIKVTLSVKAELTPELNMEELQRDLSGKDLERAREYLLQLPNIEKAKFDIFPSFLGQFRTLPRRPENIKIEVKKD